jgi:hypothetical protein
MLSPYHHLADYNTPLIEILWSNLDRNGKKFTQFSYDEQHKLVIAVALHNCRKVHAIMNPDCQFILHVEYGNPDVIGCQLCAWEWHLPLMSELRMAEELQEEFDEDAKKKRRGPKLKKRPKYLNRQQATSAFTPSKPWNVRFEDVQTPVTSVNGFGFKKVDPTLLRPYTRKV